MIHRTLFHGLREIRTAGKYIVIPTEVFTVLYASMLVMMFIASIMNDYISGKLMRTTAPPSRAVGIDIWQPVEKITSREKADISAKAKEWHIINSKW
jgi:hypothetical protein